MVEQAYSYVYYKLFHNTYNIGNDELWCSNKKQILYSYKSLFPEKKRKMLTK
jgi:hypothetical protein